MSYDHPLRAFHGDQAVKDKYLARVRARMAIQKRILGAIDSGIYRDSQQRRLYCWDLAHPWHKNTSQDAPGRLACRAWGSAHPFLIIDHINRDKADNRIENLRLVTAVTNSENRRSYAGTANNAIQAADGSLNEVALAFGVSKSLAAQIVRGELWV